jgi:hypothetical protein
MVMFVLVVDTSVMKLSIGASGPRPGHHLSGVQSAIALEALVSAAFILIGSKTGDLIGRKRLGGFITTSLSWKIAFLLEAVIIAIVLSGIKLVQDVPFTGPAPPPRPRWGRTASSGHEDWPRQTDRRAPRA